MSVTELEMRVEAGAAGVLVGVGPGQACTTRGIDRKRQALDCHASQFQPGGGSGVATRLSAPTFRQLIESRDAQFGALAGVAFAEGIVVREPVRRSGLLKHVP